VLLLVLVTAGWRLIIIQLGPDADSDAYGHHLAARQLYVDPSNQAAHWVWLPLFHWLQLPLLALGGTLQWLRVANAVVWALVPLALLGLLAWPHAGRARGAASSGNVATAAGAAALLALSGLGMQLGTTAQPEPLFALLLLVFCWAMERQRTLVAGLSLTALVLLRYEAWAVLCGAGALLSFELWLARRHGARRVLARAALIIGLPVVSILTWAVVRAPYDGGRYFAFLSDTHDFARRATGGAAPVALERLRELVHYALFVPARTFGVGIALAPLGVARLWREQRWLLASGLCVLGFVTLGHVTRATLGLERHFVAVLPLYAALMAGGARTLADIIRRQLFENERLRGLADAATRDALQVALLGALLFGVYDRTRPWLRHWSDTVSTRFAAEAEVARQLDRAPASARIYCENPVLEALVRFRDDHVQRGLLDDAPFRERILAAARQDDVYVAAALERVTLAALPGKIEYRAERAPVREAAPWDGEGALVILHVDRTTNPD
jgi:hypothetical protein